MAAGIYDILIEQGADWRLFFAYKNADGLPVNLAGYTARMQVRESATGRTKLFELTTENGRIFIDGPNGTVEVTIPASLSQPLVIDPKKLAWIDGKMVLQWVYDLELLSPDGHVTRLLQGAAHFTPEVTR